MTAYTRPCNTGLESFSVIGRKLRELLLAAAAVVSGVAVVALVPISASDQDTRDTRPMPDHAMTRTGQTTGTVQTWNAEEGWGVIDSAQTPDGCWAFYSSIVGEGFRTLTVGATVSLEWEQVIDQDGYRYRATRVEQHDS
ncbi:MULTISPECIES: cold-shock protein [unclassified Rhodococcus (in: high G+C Gram-positive bacteria)]|uniref:cold-shock protein n=1 Tax=unclassified Rhodococcus (in: high G+C Gram-positive bacteria) TaxID=192944 RepID=UPI00211C32AC|nr:MULTISPECIES: cold shock domain-containing protein [unclassified Rhodococcus (in: high G+C Gram-positive bacteria)]